MKKHYKRNYRWMLIPLCIVLGLIVLIYVGIQLIFRENIQDERIALPAVKRVSVASLQSDPLCTWDDSLMLISTEHPLPADYSPTLTTYKDSGLSMAPALVTSYESLSAAVSATVHDKLFVADAARTNAEQQAEYANDPTVATKPGCSEHEAGLALDVYVEGFSGASFIKSDAGKYIRDHATEYGFIIRYPRFAEAITGIGYEPWHIRYVGIAHSTRMAEYSLTLEEYIASLEVGAFYRSGDYIISRQQASDDTLLIPVECEMLHISPDNTGCYIITGSCKEDTV